MLTLLARSWDLLVAAGTVVAVWYVLWRLSEHLNECTREPEVPADVDLDALRRQTLHIVDRDAS